MTDQYLQYGEKFAYQLSADDRAVVQHTKNTVALNRQAIELMPGFCGVILRPNEMSGEFVLKLAELRPRLETVYVPWRQSAANVIRTGAGFPERNRASQAELASFMENWGKEEPSLLDALVLYDDHVQRGRLLSYDDEARVCGAILAFQERITQEPEPIAASFLRSI